MGTRVIVVGTSIKTRLVRIGNSRGIRIPKVLLDQADLGDQVQLDVREGQIVIRSTKSPREDWEGQFRAMAKQGDDRLLDSDVSSFTRWDEEQWQW